MTTIGFTGDVAFSRHTADAWKNENLIAPEILRYLGDTDCTVANVEGAVCSAPKTGTGTFNHASDPHAVEWLLKINAKVWNLANNHILDCGEEGLRQTMALARENGCRTLGAGLNADEAAAVVTVGNVGLVSLNYKDGYCTDGDKPGCIFFLNEEKIAGMIAAAKKTCRWCVVVVHAGAEFLCIPTAAQRKRYLRYLELGADAVVAHHPHIVQNYEVVGKKVIFYSLGNFVFDTDYQRRQRYTDVGMLIRLHFTDDAITWDHMAVRIDRETECIVPTGTPAIFCDVPPSLHEKLWPMAAWTFHKNHKVARIFGDPKRAEFDEAGWRAFEKQSSKKTCYSVYPDVWEAEKLVAKQGLPDDEPLAKYLREGISPYAE
ncbi:MAG: CapA family protein [Oscillospiraceae bacterium]|nr:CapA family protein [Oscillospiraceae bacterium]